MGEIKSKKPKVRRITMKQLADWGNRGLKPEREERHYEFGNGSITKRSKDEPYPSS